VLYVSKCLLYLVHMSFNFVSSFYDLFSRLVFGDKLLLAQREFLPTIKAGASILFLGGGTGKVLNTLLEQTSNTQIDFIEPSAGMLKRAKKNLDEKFSGRVNFINGDQNSVSPGKEYDVALVFFVYDLFREEEALRFTGKIHGALKSGGELLFTDFFPPVGRKQKIILALMYFFFRLLAKISARALPDYQKVIAPSCFHLHDEKLFMSGFVKSRRYRKEMSSISVQR
jgi:tRNA (cmo5U34)-methyltransferase